MRTQLKKLATTVALTALTFAGASVATAPVASAQEIVPSGVVESVADLPFCYGIFDTLGNGTRLCVNSVTISNAPAPSTGVFATARGGLEVCTLGKCAIAPFSAQQTGSSVNPSTVVPQIYWHPSTTVPVPRVCVAGVCTPGPVDIPNFEVILLPPGSQPATVCVSGTCASPATPRVALDSATIVKLLQFQL